jgi:hypothetical protein
MSTDLLDNYHAWFPGTKIEREVATFLRSHVERKAVQPNPGTRCKMFLVTNVSNCARIP